MEPGPHTQDVTESPIFPCGWPPLFPLFGLLVHFYFTDVTVVPLESILDRVLSRSEANTKWGLVFIRKVNSVWANYAKLGNLGQIYAKKW
jgi:hypothetical protein